MKESSIAHEVVDTAYRIHTKLGSGLLESVYETLLAFELDRRGLRAVRRVTIPVVYSQRLREDPSSQQLRVFVMHRQNQLPEERIGPGEPFARELGGVVARERFVDEACAGVGRA
jgi:hypothetical protein